MLAEMHAHMLPIPYASLIQHDLMGDKQKSNIYIIKDGEELHVGQVEHAIEQHIAI